MDSEQIRDSINEQMKQQIIISYDSVKSKLKFNKYSFELVGYDFMVVPQISDRASSAMTGMLEN